MYGLDVCVGTVRVGLRGMGVGLDVPLVPTVAIGAVPEHPDSVALHQTLAWPMGRKGSYLFRKWLTEFTCTPFSMVSS